MSLNPHISATFRRGLRYALAVFVGAVLSTLVLDAQAQEDAEESSEPGVIVVLEPRLEQEIDLSEKIAESTGRKVMGQAWFLEQVKSRGFKAKQILTREEDMKWVMSGANIDLVVYLPKDDGKLLVKVIGDEGKLLTSRVVLEDAASEFGEKETELVLELVNEEIGGAEPALLGEPDEPVARTEPAAETIVPDADLQQKIEARGARDTGDKKWLHFFAGAQVTERAFVLTDRTLRAASLRTPLYPGYRVGVVAYPFWSELPPTRSAGFLFEFAQGFDTLTLVDGSDRVPASVTQLEIELAFLYRFQGFEETAYGDAPAISLRAGAHWSNYDVDNQISTPLSTSYLAVDLGARVEQSLWVDWLGLEWDMIAHPYVGDLSDRASGTQVWGLGLSTDASINLRLFAGAHLRLGWGARVIRTWFEGIAANNREDIDAIIFEHSPRAAVNYWW